MENALGATRYHRNIIVHFVEQMLTCGTTDCRCTGVSAMPAWEALCFLLLYYQTLLKRICNGRIRCGTTYLNGATESQLHLFTNVKCMLLAPKQNPVPLTQTIDGVGSIKLAVICHKRSHPLKTRLESPIENHGYTQRHDFMPIFSRIKITYRWIFQKEFARLQCPGGKNTRL